MRTILYTFFAAALGFFLISSSGGRASVGNQGNTGAPGDNARTCITCHGSTINMSLNVEVTDASQQVVTEYVPGATYRVAVRLEGMASRFGFQMTSLIDDTEEDVETWENPTDNAKIANAQNRQYVEHDGLSSVSVFEADWTAPADNVGTITIYAAGIGANGNGNTMGDGGAINSLTLSPMTSSTDDLAVEDLIEASFANPVSSELYYTLGGNESFDITLMDQNGRMVNSWRGVFGEFTSNIESYNSGLYFLNFKTANGQFTDRIVKL